MPLALRSCPRCQVSLPVEAAANAALPRCPKCQGPLAVPADDSAATVYVPPSAMVRDVAAAPGWYYAQNKQKYGPVTLAQLRQLAGTGRLRSGDMVLQQGGQQWQVAGAVPELFPPAGTNPAAAKTPGWCYARQRKRFGPLPLAQVRHLIALKQIQPTDMVLPPGQTKWQPAASCAELFAPPPAPPQPSPAAPASAPTGWYYAQNKQRVGPVSDEQLHLLAGMGALRPTDMVLAPGGAKWQAASSVARLFPQPPAPAPAPPPPPASNGTVAPVHEATPAGWYYLQGKKKVGPVTLEQMQQLVAFGMLHGTDMVLPQARTKWFNVSELPELMPKPQAAAPPPGWHYAVNNKKCGPIARTELEQLAAAGKLLPSDMVLPEGSKQWTSAGLIDGLFPALAARPHVDAEAPPEEDSVFPMAPPKAPEPVSPEAEAVTELVEEETEPPTEESAPPIDETPAESDPWTTEEPDHSSIIADDTFETTEPDSGDSLLSRMADFEEPPSVVADDQPKASASVFDSFIGSMIKDQPLPLLMKPRLRPASNRACPHCHGTAYCGRSWDGAGIMESGPACASCKAKSGLDEAGDGKVTCSYCEGKGFEADGPDGQEWPPDAVAWRLRGLACSDVGNYEQAIAAFSQALDLEPSYAEAYYDRGWAFMAVGRCDEGEIDLAEAARLSPKYAGATRTETDQPRGLFGWLRRK